MRRTASGVVMLLAGAALHAETGAEAWLRYAALDDGTARAYRAIVPAVVTALSDEPEVASARDELIRGVRGMLGRTLRTERRVPAESAIVLGTVTGFAKTAPQFALPGNLQADAYTLKTVMVNGVRYTVIMSSNARGVLYGTFAFLRKIALGEPVTDLDEGQAPYAPVRWVNQWDNLDGSI